MRGEDDPRADRNLNHALDENGAARLELRDDVSVVNDVPAHVDGRPPHVQLAVDGLHRPLDAGAEAARLRDDQTSGHRPVTRGLGTTTSVG